MADEVFLPVRDVMSSPVITVEEDDTVDKVAKLLSLIHI